MREPSELPIIFGDESVRGIYAGRKTQTRRVIRELGNPQVHARAAFLGLEQDRAWFGDSIPDDPCPISIRCPYLKGQRRWVREPFARDGNLVIFKAEEPDSGPWVSPFYLRRSEARLRIDLTDVRVERLKSISDEDVHAEGCKDHLQFFERWNALNAKRGFRADSDPWVFALTFRRVDG